MTDEEENRENMLVMEQAPTTEELNDPRRRRRLMQAKPVMLDGVCDGEEDRIMCFSSLPCRR